MKTQVRLGTFETNSSSTHTIAVSKTLEIPDVHERDIYPDWNMEECFTFGRHFYLMNSIGNRVAYLVIAWLHCSEDDNRIRPKTEREAFYNKIIDMVVKNVNQYKWYKGNEKKDVADKLRAIFQKIEYDLYGWYKDGYDAVYPHGLKNNVFVKNDIYLEIDHTEDLPPFVKFVTSDDAILERFILSNNSFIATGGDEEYGYYMKQVGFEYDYDNFMKFKRRANAVAKKLNLDIFFKGN